MLDLPGQEFSRFFVLQNTQRQILLRGPGARIGHGNEPGAVVPARLLGGRKPQLRKAVSVPLQFLLPAVMYQVKTEALLIGQISVPFQPVQGKGRDRLKSLGQRSPILHLRVAGNHVQLRIKPVMQPRGHSGVLILQEKDVFRSILRLPSFMPLILQLHRKGCVDELVPHPVFRTVFSRGRRLQRRIFPESILVSGFRPVLPCGSFRSRGHMPITLPFRYRKQHQPVFLCHAETKADAVFFYVDYVHANSPRIISLYPRYTGSGLIHF